MAREKDRPGDTRDRILRAATEVFVEKGLAGARMQEIADRAEINKAMLHYYFTSKEHLYETVLVTMLSGLMTRIRVALETGDASAEERLRRFIEAYFDVVKEHQDIPKLIMQDLLTAGGEVVSYFRKAAEQTGILGGFPAVRLIQEGIESGSLRRVDPKQTIVSLISLVVFYFVARPIQNALLQLDDDDRDRFLEERKHHVVDLFLHGVLALPTQHEKPRGGKLHA